jgi:hypothetical protein
MSPGDRPKDEAASGGKTTGASGTPFAVDVTGDRQSRDVWIVLLAGPVIWLTHFMIVYLVAEAGCTGDGPGLEVFDPPVPTAVTLVATALGCLACLGFATWAYRRWTVVRRSDGGLDDDPDGRGSLAFVGLLLSLLSVVAILFVGVPAPFLSPC